MKMDRDLRHHSGWRFDQFVIDADNSASDTPAIPAIPDPFVPAVIPAPTSAPDSSPVTSV